MLGRFARAAGRRFIIEALEFQPLIAEDNQLAATLSDICAVEGFEAGCIITNRGNYAKDIYFILAGSVSVSVHGREVAIRRAGEHVGGDCRAGPEPV